MSEMNENSNMRMPPQSLEAEQALLGAILTNNRAMEKVNEFLKPEHSHLLYTERYIKHAKH